MFNLFLTYNIYKNMKAPHSELFDGLDEKTRRDIILGKKNRFVHNGKTYNVTDGEGNTIKSMVEIDEFIEKCKFDTERINKINKIQQKINPQLLFKRHWWSNIKFFIQKLF